MKFVLILVSLTCFFSKVYSANNLFPYHYIDFLINKEVKPTKDTSRFLSGYNNFRTLDGKTLYPTIKNGSKTDYEKVANFNFIVTSINFISDSNLYELTLYNDITDSVIYLYNPESIYDYELTCVDTILFPDSYFCDLVNKNVNKRNGKIIYDVPQYSMVGIFKEVYKSKEKFFFNVIEHGVGEDLVVRSMKIVFADMTEVSISFSKKKTQPSKDSWSIISEVEITNEVLELLIMKNVKEFIFSRHHILSSNESEITKRSLRCLLSHDI